jgi:tight adherence protein C
VILSATGLLLMLTTGNVLFGLGLALFGWLWLDIWLARAARARQGRIDRDLPDFLDVLAVSVGAGIGFRPALERVAEGVGGPVAEEVLTSLRQMQLGSTRREAFESLRERNDSEFVSQFVTAMLQAEELGVPLGEALRDLAKDMRRGSYQRARQRAQRAAPRVSLIVTTLLVPGAMLLILVTLVLSSDADIGGLFGE